MTEIPPAPPAPDGPGPTGGVARSPLSDGDGHRMHPLTPLFRGGLVLVIVSGIIIANLRDRVIDVLFDGFFPGGFTGTEDPIDFVLGHDLVLSAESEESSASSLWLELVVRGGGG